VGTILDDEGSSFLGILADRRTICHRQTTSQFLVGQVLLFSLDKKRSVSAEVDRKVLYLSAVRLLCS
jgi:hypothetical protein